MTFANDPTDPVNMTPEERVAEVAAILAEGVLRLRAGPLFRRFRAMFPPPGIFRNLGRMALMTAPEQALMDTVVNACREAENRSYTMVQNVKIEVAALRRMSPAELREKYLAVFGEPTRTGNKDFLCKRLAWRLQSMAEGSLSDRARQRAAELARDADIRTTMPRQPTATAGATQRVRAAPAANPERLPPPGAVLARQYRGRLIEVTVLPKGFEWEGRVYRSLSAVAQAVTGAHWNGHLFFGLKNGDKQ